MKRKVAALSDETAIELVAELLDRASESFCEKEIRLYVFGATTEDVSWTGVHGVVGRILPEHAMTTQGTRAFPGRKAKIAKWFYDNGRYSKLASCPTCGK